MLTDRIADDLKAAMKAKEEARTSILRMVHAALKNRRIELMRDLSDDEALAVLHTLAKQYRDALADFEKGNRPDLAAKTESEIVVLESYLPQAPSEESVREAVKATVVELGASGPADFGRVMSASMKKLGPGASGEIVSRIVRESLV